MPEMPAWSSLALTVAGFIIVTLIGIVGWMLKDQRGGLVDSMREGFTEVKSMFAALTARFDKLDERQRECMTWEDWRALGLEEKVREHDKDLASIKAICEATKHGGK